MRRSLVIVRTHRGDAASLAAYDRFAAAGLDVVFCVDERAGPAEMGGRAKVAFDAAVLDAAGLYAHPACGWRCGDYFFAVVRAAHPDYEQYWLIEPDVRINTADLRGFLERFGCLEADLLAPQFGPRGPQWGWTRTAVAAGLAPYGCVFPIVRLSGRAIDHLAAARRGMGADPALANADGWPNDEAFTASVLMAGGFACADLKAGAPCYDTVTLGVGAVVDFGVIEAKPPDEMIYHPVRDFGAWLEAAEARVAAYTSTAVGLRADASFLQGVALACLRHPTAEESALVPLLLEGEAWRVRRWAAGSGHDTAAADAQRAVASRQRLARAFGVAPGRPELGVAHLAMAKAGLGDTAGADDFACGPGVALGRLPWGVMVPYAVDGRDGSRLFTAHVRVSGVDGMAAQRAAAKVVVRVRPGASCDSTPCVTPLNPADD